MAKPQPVECITRRDGRHAQVQFSYDWMGRSVAGTSRGHVSLRRAKPFLEAVKDHLESSHCKVAGDSDPVLELESHLQHTTSALAEVRDNSRNHKNASRGMLFGDAIPDLSCLRAAAPYMFKEHTIRAVVSGEIPTSVCPG